MSDRYLYIALAGFGVGVLVRSFFNLGVFFPVFVILVGLGVFILAWLNGLRRERQTLLLTPIFLFALALGILRFEMSNGRESSVLDPYVGSQNYFQGVVSEEPDRRENGVLLTVDVLKAGMADVTVLVSSRIIATVDFYPEFKYGDEIKIFGKLEKPKNFSDGEEGRVFDYKSYLAKDGIYYVSFRPKVELLSEHQGNRIKESLLNIKKGFVENVGRVIPEPEASLLSGLVVGAKQSLGKKLLDDFRAAGIIHIVVLSGYNITIIADFVMRLATFLPRLLGMALGASSILLFAVMTGASATIVRASIMALLVILARATGRTYEVTRALLLAGFFMILQNPKILVFDISFQLSFLSTVALIYVSPIIERRVGFVTEKWKIREVVTSTVATQIFVMPFLLYKMGTLSLVSLPVNLLVLFLIPATMFFGFIAGVSGFVSVFISYPFAWVAHVFLAYELLVVEFFSKFEYSEIFVPYFPFWLAVIIYLGYAVALFLLSKKLSPAKKEFKGL